VSSDPINNNFVVDDAPIIASALKAMMRMNGFSATFFASPREALAARVEPLRL
jgi:FixJ family two-component response regulator